jgi:hypothetical protein
MVPERNDVSLVHDEGFYPHRDVTTVKMANDDVVVRETGPQGWSGLRTTIMIHSHWFFEATIVRLLFSCHHSTKIDI